CQHYYSTPRTF
nr:immunoglobulin light chain junction region [Macaca mulatta]MPN81611.1 immunoglobulin light chain junction region [Macaca mulatta]MPN81639.1 immunoglobulin light chain junction region [Macaca mulatta]MPN81892.1 immunoglobulin light chain junction region [Macaca mulatta]MPN81910.1 immunoglobulin light chain junction region [Macaca mulatta]